MLAKAVCGRRRSRAVTLRSICRTFPPREGVLIVLTVDAKGRLLIPHRDREGLGLRAGDAFVAECEGDVLRFAEAPNRFDRLADVALREYGPDGHAVYAA